MNRRDRYRGIFAIAVCLLFLFNIGLVEGQQTGASIDYLSNSTKGADAPGEREGDQKGYIHTIELTSEQQDYKWKAYVGNVSSTFVLDDADDYSIYQWQLTSFSGQVYITRNDTIDWGSVSCATPGNKDTEDGDLGRDTDSEDSVNKTFSSVAHKQFDIGSTNIGQNTCFSTATWVNNTQQTPSTTQPFTEVLLWDSDTTSMIYTTFVENDVSGYRDDGTPGTTYDFQAIVPEDDQQSNPALTYYFYLELS